MCGGASRTCGALSNLGVSDRLATSLAEGSCQPGKHHRFRGCIRNPRCLLEKCNQLRAEGHCSSMRLEHVPQQNPSPNGTQSLRTSDFQQVRSCEVWQNTQNPKPYILIETSTSMAQNSWLESSTINSKSRDPDPKFRLSSTPPTLSPKASASAFWVQLGGSFFGGPGTECHSANNRGAYLMKLPCLHTLVQKRLNLDDRHQFPLKTLVRSCVTSMFCFIHACPGGGSVQHNVQRPGQQ